MEFDVQTLSPTYRLQMGLPGKSNAFEISRRLGLPEEIIQDAAASLTTEDVAVAAMLANLEDMRRELAEEKDKAQVLAASAAERAKYIREKEQSLKSQEAEIIRKANAKAQKIVEDVLAQSRALYEEEQRQIKEKKSAERVWQEAQKKLKSWREQLEEEAPAQVFAGTAPKTVAPGDHVFLPKLNQYGNVIGKPDRDGNVMLQVGVLKMKYALADLRLADQEKPSKGRVKRRGSAAALAMQKTSTIGASLNLHGLETMEALPVLDKYIDDAFLAGLREVQINHGRGTGALRHFVQDYLRGHRLVKSFRDGSLQEGGSGVTIVELNQ